MGRSESTAVGQAAAWAGVAMNWNCPNNGISINIPSSQLSNNQSDDSYWRATNYKSEILFIPKKIFDMLQKNHFVLTLPFKKV